VPVLSLRGLVLPIHHILHKGEFTRFRGFSQPNRGWPWKVGGLLIVPGIFLEEKEMEILVLGLVRTGWFFYDSINGS
jgi:hypothetical protein